MGARLEEMSDAALVVAVGRWRNDALAELYRRHAGAVYSLARRPMNDVADAEGVVQEVFLRLWNAPEKFDAVRGAYALDAVDGDEAEEVRAHLDTCPRCADEVHQHREAAAALAFAGERAPEGLWDRIQTRLEDTPPPLDMDRILPSRASARA